MARTGAYAYVKYGWESTFKDGASSRDKVFGRAQRITGVTRRENLEMIYELGKREPATGVYKQFEGSFTAEFILSNPWIFKALLGSVQTTGTETYTHTFTKSKTPVSFGVELGFEGEEANVVRLLKGCVMNNFSLTATVDDVIRCRSEIFFADEDTTSLSSVITDTFDPFVFQHATLELPTGTVLAEVQSFELTIGNTALMVRGLGNEKPVSAVWQAFDVTGRLSITMKNSTLLNYLRGKQSGLKLSVTDGVNTISFEGTEVYFGEHSVNYEPNVIIIEELPIAIRDLQIVAVNDVPSVP